MQRSITNVQSVAANRVPDVATVDSQIYLPMIVRPDCPPANGIKVEFGEVNTGSIATASQIDTYFVCATAGDIIRMDISRTSGSFNPQVSVYRPNGTLLCSDGTIGSSLTKVCTLDASGTHIVQIGDWGTNNTGGYGFYSQRLNNPADPLPVNFSDVIPATISSIVEHDTYTISGEAGDIVRLDISRTSGSFNPYVAVYRPNGTLLCSDGTIGSALTHQCTLAASGTYVILIGDWGINNTGGYDFYLQRLNNPSNPIPVNFSDVIPATINSIVEHDTYTINGEAGDIIRLDISRTSGSFNPYVAVYRPNGTLLCSDGTIGSALTHQCTLAVSGTYVILIGDWGINNTGGYDFYLQRLNNPSNPIPINFSDVIPATISSIVEHDTYTINGEAGDIIRLDISRTSGSFNPYVAIYRPNGTLLCSDGTIGSALTYHCTLAVSGTYVILIGDWGINNTGGYDFYLQRLNNPSNPIPINFSDVIPATISSIVEHDTYAISGEAGDIVRLDISRTSGSFNPYVAVYRPDGTLLCSDGTIGSALTHQCTLAVSGTYVILIGDWGINNTGGYDFYLQRLNNPSNPIAIDYGSFVTGAITSIVEHDTYVFSGTVGDTIRMVINRAGGSFNPSVAVYRPGGTLLCSQGTIGASLTLECTLDISGTHVILIGDWGINNTGGYEMSFTKIN